MCLMRESLAFLGLKPLMDIEDWDTDLAVVGAARQLCRHTDNLKPYLGIQADSMMLSSPGSNISCGYKMARGQVLTTGYTREIPHTIFPTVVLTVSVLL
ncbi:uncharacterized protein PHACADRAFT_138623 [Phanerochaete carnosa HHB-10118-sp]|uniref:Uncharacterized protein n=1 Tax=Phanerochaete carnosa (strain HHB-10118-sp) TaxID=650164 RepID=K5V4C6_PHACS|nr:uncharacterized protein PHACADRAFT_138623 [Phanerochaete carnosa HHB-10118-sp]EKM57456.1 hypothetical protein PHACADRAFT_138623 [Phanerochaete carnosa HHB-10118-sp]